MTLLAGGIFFAGVGVLAIGISALLKTKIPEKRDIRLELTKAALTGILADPEDRHDEILPDETCEEAVARLAVKQADAVHKKLYGTNLSR